jgi:hypothetical protein
VSGPAQHQYVNADDPIDNELIREHAAISETT